MKRQRQALRQVASGLGPVGDVGSETLVAYAAKQGLTAEDGKGDHSPFTTAILHNLPEPGLDIRLAFGRVRDEVLKITSNRQEPYVYGSLGGSNVALVPAPEKAAPQVVDQDKMRADYELVMKVFEKVGSKTPAQGVPGAVSVRPLFRARARAAQSAGSAREAGACHRSGDAVTPRADPDRSRARTSSSPRYRKGSRRRRRPSPDNLAWEEVKDTTDPDALRRFIQRFRNSPKVLEAQRRLDILLRNQREREEAARREKAEAEMAKAWEAVQGTDDPNRLRDFARRYPSSEHAAEAKQRADGLVRAAQERDEQARREKAEAELAKAWEAVQGTDDQAKLRDFIRRYPATQYTDAAKQRLDAVVRAAQEREEAARAAAAEERRLKAEAEMRRAFDAAETTSDQAVVRDFIRRYPDSPYVAQAKRHLDTLIVAEQERKEQERIAAAEARRQKMEAEAAAAWNSVKNSSSPAEVQNFIKRFPESTLALRDATERLGVLDREAKERVAKAQAEAAAARAAWDRIKDTNDVAVVQDFIKQYPNTPTALNDAKQYLDVLDKRIKEREAKARMEADAAQAWNRIQNTTDRGRGAQLHEALSGCGRDPDPRRTAAGRARARSGRPCREGAGRGRRGARRLGARQGLQRPGRAARLHQPLSRTRRSRPATPRLASICSSGRRRSVRPRPAPRPPPARPRKRPRLATREAKEKAEAEMLQAWDATKDSRDPSEFRAFIRRYPSFAFRDARPGNPSRRSSRSPR